MEPLIKGFIVSVAYTFLFWIIVEPTTWSLTLWSASFVIIAIMTFNRLSVPYKSTRSFVALVLVGMIVGGFGAAIINAFYQQ